MKNRIFVGPPGSGKTYRAKYEAVKAIWDWMDEEERRKPGARFYNPDNFSEEAFRYVETHYVPSVKLVSLHEGMTTSDFTEGIAVETADGRTAFAETEKLVLQLLAEMKEYSGPGVLILDDIHRVNLAGVLGELLSAFSHRNERVTLPSGRAVCVPENLYVFMTMNTLQPEFPLDVSILGNFQVTYMENTAEKLEAALDDRFYKCAYYNIDADIIDGLIEIQRAIFLLADEMEKAGAPYEPVFDVEELFFIDMGYCFDELTAESLLSLPHPVVWEKRADIGSKYRKRYNILAGAFCEKLNEACEMYSKLCSEKTMELLEDFKREARREYEYYSSFLACITPEYVHDKEKYQTGYAYFLPGRGFSMWNAKKLLQNKIRAQVLPLLRQYQSEGVIAGCRLPGEEHTAASYTRDPSEVEEERIEIVLNREYREIFLELYGGRKSTAGVKNPMNRSQQYNATYSTLFEIVRDMIEHPLVNNWRIMDLLCRDKEIFFKTDATHLYEGCLLALSKLSDKIVTAGTDNTPGNQSLTSYKRDLHAFYYHGQKYLLLSKIGFERSDSRKTVNTCRLARPVTTRYHNLYPIVKVLVGRYLKLFLDNLEAMWQETTDKTEISEILRDIRRVKDDLKTLDGICWHGADADERRWNLLDDIRALPTWSLMISGRLKGAYKKMDDRYQAVMDSTGIHQMILQGPPGTSKTYGVKEFLAMQANLIWKKGEHWDDAELNAIQLISKDGEYVLPEENVLPFNNVYWDIIQFHPSYTYEDFVRGIAVSASEGNYTEVKGEISGDNAVNYAVKLRQPAPVMYKTVNRTLGKMAKIAREYYNEENPELSAKFYLVIDEINRANLATVFGELIYALEYRDSEVATPYSVGGDAKLEIPDNLYIVGTMNTADKSIASIDYAIRRRFLFFPVLPDIRVVFESVQPHWHDAAELRLFHITERLFDSFLNADDYNRSDVQIGHTYFLRKTGAADTATQMKYRFLYQVIPVLREYYNDGILTDEAYGREPAAYEMECISMIRKMTQISDVEELERLYDELAEKLLSDEFGEDIKKKLSEKHVPAE